MKAVLYTKYSSPKVLFLEEVENSTLKINAVMNVAMKDDKTKKCAEFVDKLLQIENMVKASESERVCFKS
ncbi:hypothetical protein [Methanobacterium formicicum]|uniref:Uncharacterized protein n=1 Tax=Methanobacterium formicicum (strain DSM 3637 / PP1) TaxID=1204725 RepID=K2QZF1_METFP|nr:hypothetical protein [Methanobacterium formicicum]EKF85668.1 hypothetical protein A994_08046 [Methanobacterium formicicum DSM 3637]